MTFLIGNKSMKGLYELPEYKVLSAGETEELKFRGFVDSDLDYVTNLILKKNAQHLKERGKAIDEYAAFLKSEARSNYILVFVSVILSFLLGFLISYFVRFDLPLV
jgi:hypothetical protein